MPEMPEEPVMAADKITAIQKVLKFCDDSLIAISRYPAGSEYQKGYKAAVDQVMAVAIAAQEEEDEPGMKAGTQPSDAVLDFVSVEIRLPKNDTASVGSATSVEVLVRGWGEKRKHYVYDFAQYEVTTACRRWIARDQRTLSFEPIEWARLPQPKED